MTWESELFESYSPALWAERSGRTAGQLFAARERQYDSDQAFAAFIRASMAPDALPAPPRVYPDRVRSTGPVGIAVV